MLQQLRHELMAVELTYPLSALPAAFERWLDSAEAPVETSKCIYFYFEFSSLRVLSLLSTVFSYTETMDCNDSR